MLQTSTFGHSKRVAVLPPPEPNHRSGNSHPAAWIPGLDGLRGLAILMVLLFHYGTVLNRNNPLQHLLAGVADVGWTGVDLFFVLSGFLITSILLDSRDAENFYSSFYLRRVVRIFPVYYCSLLFLFFMFPRIEPGYAAIAPPPGERVWYFSYLQNWTNVLVTGSRERLVGHYWSLGIEEQFYMIWPWIVYRCTANRLLKVSIGGVAVSLLLRLGLLVWHVSPETIYRNTFARMDSLLIGAACACLLRNETFVKYAGRWVPSLWAVVPITLVVSRELLRPFSDHNRAVQGFGFTAIALSYGALLVGIVVTKDGQSAVQRFFNSGFMRIFGKYSYGAYIWHQLVRAGTINSEVKLIGHQVPALLNLPLMIAVTLAVSMVSYALIERPFLSLKRHFKLRSKVQDYRPAVAILS